MTSSKKRICGNREILLKIVGKIIKEKRLEIGKGILLHAYEYDIPSSSLNMIEKGERDVQFTTLWKIANSFNLSLSEFVSLVEKELPKDFELN